VGSTICVLSGVAVLAVLVGHAAESGGGRAGGCRAGGRSRDADSTLADCGIVISSLAVRVGAAAERNGRRGWRWRRSDADIALAGVAWPPVETVGVGLTADIDVGAIRDGCSGSQSSECYNGERCECRVMHCD
jgi:hypothetical protein